MRLMFLLVFAIFGSSSIVHANAEEKRYVYGVMEKIFPGLSLETKACMYGCMKGKTTGSVTKTGIGDRYTLNVQGDVMMRCLAECDDDDSTVGKTDVLFKGCSQLKNDALFKCLEKNSADHRLPASGK